jgi:phosphoribosylanthranilate isomerase
MYVKVCGITRLEDALCAVAVGADALGFNFVPGSKRRIEVGEACDIISRVRDRVQCIAVVADLSVQEAEALLGLTRADRLQLHGDETPEQVAQLAPHAFKALRIGTAEDLQRARAFGSHPLLVDAKVAGQLGGTGRTLDWPLVEPLARERALLLAGGLTPENVATAVRIVQPWGVDTASGVERADNPRHKDPEKLGRFLREARGAAPNGQLPKS